MRNVLLSVIGLLLIVGAFFAAKTIIANKKRFRPKSAKVIKTVFVDTVHNGTIPIQISANGSLVAKRRLEIYSEVQGIFKGGAKLFKTGVTYKKGQSLINIDASEYYASVQSAKSNLYNLITSIMPDVRLDYPDMYKKWQAYLDNFDINKTIPKLPEASSEKEKYFITGRGIYTNYFTIKNLEQRLSKYRIAAPFSGILTQALVTEGTLIRQGQKLGEYIDTSAYEMEVAIGKEYADLLKIGASVTLSNLNKTNTYKGTVTRINGSIDKASQTITTYIEVKDAGLKEGMYLEAYLNTKNEEVAIQIDRNLLYEQNKIFIVRDSILDMIEVNPVYFLDKKVVVKEVPEETIMLAKNVPGAYPGMLVKIYSDKKEISSIDKTADIAKKQ